MFFGTMFEPFDFETTEVGLPFPHNMPGSHSAVPNGLTVHAGNRVEELCSILVSLLGLIVHRLTNYAPPTIGDVRKPR
jgi:hypothetical protein